MVDMKSIAIAIALTAATAAQAVPWMAHPSSRPPPGFTLITVTNGGGVFHAPGYQTLRMCEQAKSLALTGMTIEQKEAADAAEAERRAAYIAKHPRQCPACLQPTADPYTSYMPVSTGIKHAECIKEFS